MGFILAQPFLANLCFHTPQQRIETGAGSSDGAAAHAGFSLLDAQFRNDHLLQFGLIEIPKQQFQRMLHTALKTHLDWPFIASENDIFAHLAQAKKRDIINRMFQRGYRRAGRKHPS